MELQELKMSDYTLIKTPFAFLDETGLLNSGRDRFFCLGMIKCQKPYLILNEVEKIRHRNNYFLEAKWTRLFPNNLPIYSYSAPNLRVLSPVLKKNLKIRKHV